MGIPAFLNDRDKEQSKKGKKKKDFRERCLKLLEQIKQYNEERYLELKKTFHSQYDKINIQRKKIQGFYSQLVEELKTFKETAGESMSHLSPEQAAKEFDVIYRSTKKKVANLAQKAKQEVKEAVDNVTKTTKKKLTKKATASGQKKKSSAGAKKKAAKKVAKKKTAPTNKKKAASKKKVAKKTAKKATKKKTVAKKATAKKASAKTKKTAKKKVAKKAASKKKAGGRKKK